MEIFQEDFILLEKFKINRIMSQILLTDHNLKYHRVIFEVGSVWLIPDGAREDVIRHFDVSSDKIVNSADFHQGRIDTRGHVNDQVEVWRERPWCKESV